MTDERNADPAWPGPLVHPRFDVHPSVELAPLSIIGAPDGSDSQPGRIESGCSIGSFCHIAFSSVVGKNVKIDNYVRIGARSVIGAETQVLYNARIYSDVSIGTNCIISGDVPNAVIIGDAVTFMGEIAHSHRNAHIPWNEYVEPSPIIMDRSVVGVRALLVGPVQIGPRSYVGAGEVVRHDIPPDTVYFKGELSPLESWKGLITVRGSAETT